MRSLCTVSDLSIEEQLKIYDLAKQVKRSIKTSDYEAQPQLRINDENATTFLIFMEDSTRTKESFRAASLFHGGKVNVFDCTTSSFNKHETITDTIKMLCGYSTGPVTFIIRSKIEGVCRWLADVIPGFISRNNLFPVRFINAGDGRHEHPTQELLDEFSFLEQLDFDRSSIHIALIGDLVNGRTIHSKIEGLQIFRNVAVDLIAPPLLALPDCYETRMIKAGFKIRKFGSLDEYLAVSEIAPIFYFTRLQLERMSVECIAKETELRASVTFRDDMRPVIPKGTRFYHPLPRNGKTPEIPFSVDDTDLNAWDRQSSNGFIVRIALLKALQGFSGTHEDGIRLDDRSCENPDCVTHQREVKGATYESGVMQVCRYCDQEFRSSLEQGA